MPTEQRTVRIRSASRMPLPIGLRTLALGDETATDEATAERLVNAGQAAYATDEFDGKTMAQLRKYAEEHQPPIEIPQDAKSKDDVLAVIRTATFEEN